VGSLAPNSTARSPTLPGASRCSGGCTQMYFPLLPKKKGFIRHYQKKFVTQSRTGLQIYEGHDDQLNRPGPMA
jgi:hypothetical protein